MDIRSRYPRIMSIPKRHSSPAFIAVGCRTFFVTPWTANKRPLLQTSRAAQLFMEVLDAYRTHGKFQLHDFVVMPDHIHVLLTLENTMSIERAVQFIKGGFSYRAGKELGFNPPVWQKGFSEVRIVDEVSFEKYRAYIWNNPVARGLALTPREYPFGSVGSGVKLDPGPQGLKPSSDENALRYG